MMEKDQFNSLNEDYTTKCADHDKLDELFKTECERLQSSIQEVQREVVVREYLIDQYKKTESDLTDQAKECKSVLQNILEQNDRLHDKISGQQKIENLNAKALEDFKGDIVQKVGEVKEGLVKFYSQEEDFVKRVSGSAVSLCDLLNSGFGEINSIIKQYQELANENVVQLRAFHKDMKTILDESVEESVMKARIIFRNHYNILHRMTFSVHQGIKKVHTGIEDAISKTSALVEDLNALIHTLHTAKADNQSLRDHFSAETSTLGNHLKFESEDCNRRIRSITDLDYIFGALDDKSQDNLEQIVDYWQTKSETIKKLEIDLEEKLRSIQDIVSHNLSLTLQNKNMNLNSLGQIQDLVQGMTYTATTPKGTTPKRTTSADLDYPKNFQSTAQREVLLKEFNLQEMENSKPPLATNKLFRLDQKAHSNSETIGCQQSSSTGNIENFNLRRSSSLPDVFKPDEVIENKENMNSQTSDKKKRNFSTRSHFKTSNPGRVVLNETNNTQGVLRETHNKRKVLSETNCNTKCA